ncbi:MAG TPA: terminase [Actinoplanes sp.]|nr:terminase [Actinoplanes sp.]
MWTPPLQELTPETSFGFDVLRFSDRVLRRRLYPWQRWLLVHAGELLPDGRPRFRTVLVEVGRQNGKTECVVVLSAYWLFVQRVARVLGTSTTLDYAREPLDKVVQLVEGSALRHLVKGRWVRETNGQVRATTRARCEYRVSARGPGAGRSLTVDRFIADELREHRDYKTWDAAYNAMSAVPDAQAWAMSNAGGADSMVLNDYRDLAVEDGDETLGYFGWTNPAGVDPLDVAAIAQANPSLGLGRIRLDTVLAEARAAVRAGGPKLTGYLTEKLCVTVPTLDPAIDPAAWAACLDPGDLSKVRRRVAAMIDVSPDARHVSLVAAALLPDGRVRIDPVEAWAGPDAVVRAVAALPALLARVRPRVFGWAPTGPGAELAADLTERPGFPPDGVELRPITGDMAAACMALRSLVAARRVAHSGDPLIDAHVGAAERLPIGDRWVFHRRGRGHVDAAYAAAGAVHLARTLPAPITARRFVVVGG